jgi:murein DD-endopeptidase MepM/ murein hydrolase activator NlpD
VASERETQMIDQNVNDSSIANLLYAVLNEIGGWNPDNIYIQPLPNNIASTVYKLFNEFTDENKKLNQEVVDFFHALVGSGSFGTASAGGGNSSNTPGGSTPTSNIGNAENQWGITGDPAGHAKQVGYPLKKLGQSLGGRFIGTHQPGNPFRNWQSCNAVDIGIPVGTEVIALDDGVIKQCGGSYSTGSGRTEGLTFHLVTSDNEWFYQHCSARYVTDEQPVRKGQRLGRSGKGGGVPHLHLGCIRDDPTRLITPKIPGS